MSAGLCERVQYVDKTNPSTLRTGEALSVEVVLHRQRDGHRQLLEWPWIGHFCPKSGLSFVDILSWTAVDWSQL